MKKHLLLNLTFLFFTVGLFSQNSGTFSGTLSGNNTQDFHSFTANGNGRYIFTGNYTGNGNWISALAYVGTVNDYNIGSSK